MPRDASGPAKPIRGGGALLLSIFLVSGASGLVYQVVWSRALTLVFGSTTHGVAVVLAAFMGGLALGSWLAGRAGDRLAFPLRTYGLLEAGIAVLATAVLLLTPALDAAYRAIYPYVHLSLPTLTLARFLLASAFLLPATTLMGATLPVLSAYLERRSAVEGQGASVLYAANTTGAVAGTLAGGFWLLPVAGMTGATLLAAAGNVAAAVGGLYLSRRVEEEGRPLSAPVEPSPAAVDRPAAAGPSRGTRAAVGAAMALSGAAALILEVAWTRTLSMVLGSSTHAFTVMLATFLVGLAAGSAVAARFLGSVRTPLVAFALAELLCGLTTYVGVFLFPELPYAFIRVYGAAHDVPALFQAGRFAIAASVMLAPTLMFGAAFPLAVRCLRIGAAEAARPVGRLYAVNTLGAIAGSLAAGFALVPWLGLEQTIVAGALVNLAVGGWILAASGTGRRAARFGLAGAVLATLPALPLGSRPWNPIVMASGVFQYAPHDLARYPTRRDFWSHHEARRALFYKDGSTTTVTVEKRPARPDGKVWLILTVNGKVDASTTADMETQVLLGHLPLLAARAPRRALIVGWGSGVTAGSALTHADLESVRAVEIEPAVLEASRLFRDFNHDPFGDSRLRLEVNDARHALLVDEETYDVVVSEPSNPWLAGPSRLFTREFFRLVKSRLAPDGILCQWVQLYGLDWESYLVLLRTLHDVFGHVVVMKGSPGDTLVMASASPIRFDVARIAERMKAPAVEADLRRVNVGDPASLLSRFRAGGDALAKLAGPGRLNTDDNALVEFAASRALYRDTGSENDVLLGRSEGSVLEHADVTRLGPVEAARFAASVVRADAAAGLVERARRDLALAEALAGPPAAAAEILAARGALLARAGDGAGAAGAWREALGADPGCLPAALDLGKHLLEKARDAAGALDVFRRAAESHPGSAEARMGMGRALLAAGRSGEAVDVLKAAAALDPPRPIAPFIHMHWGRACLAAGDASCAAREISRFFEEWREIPKPGEGGVDAAIDLGRAYLALGKDALAREQFRVATELSGSIAGWSRAQAEEAMRLEDLASAESHLRRALEWNAADAPTYVKLGDLLMRQRRWQDALGVWSDLLKRQPLDPTALSGMVEALLRTGRLKEATPFLERLVDVEEDPERIDRMRRTLAAAAAAP